MFSFRSLLHIRLLGARSLFSSDKGILTKVQKTAEVYRYIRRKLAQSCRGAPTHARREESVKFYRVSQFWMLLNCIFAMPLMSGHKPCHRFHKAERKAQILSSERDFSLNIGF